MQKLNKKIFFLLFALILTILGLNKIKASESPAILLNPSGDHKIVYLQKDTPWVETAKAYLGTEEILPGPNFLITGEVLHNTIGDYEINYRAIAGSNVTEKTRKVLVRDFKAGVVIENENKEAFSLPSGYSNLEIKKIHESQLFSDYFVGIGIVSNGPQKQVAIFFVDAVEFKLQEVNGKKIHIFTNDFGANPEITFLDVVGTNSSNRQIVFGIHQASSDRKVKYFTYNPLTETQPSEWFVDDQSTFTKIVDAFISKETESYIVNVLEGSHWNRILVDGSTSPSVLNTNITSVINTNNNKYLFVEETNLDKLILGSVASTVNQVLTKTFNKTKFSKLLKINGNIFALGTTDSINPSDLIYQKNGNKNFIAKLSVSDDNIIVANLLTTKFELKFLSNTLTTLVFEDFIYNLELDKLVETKIVSAIENFDDKYLSFGGKTTFVFDTEASGSTYIKRFTLPLYAHETDDKIYNYEDTINEKPVKFLFLDEDFSYTNYTKVKANFDSAIDQDNAGNYAVTAEYTFSFNLTNYGNDLVYLQLQNKFTKNTQHNLIDSHTYLGDVTLNVLGSQQVTINSTIVANDGTYNIPGENQQVVISGKNGYKEILSITINLNLEILKGTESSDEEGYFYGPVTINFSGGIATLNGELITSGHVFRSVGNNQLIITGANGFNHSKTIKVASKVTGVIDNQILDTDDAKTSIMCPNAESLMLNDSAYTEGEEITEAGNHVFKINGKNGYQRVIHFTIKVNIYLNDQSIVLESYDEKVNVRFSKGNAKLNGSPLAGEASYLITSFGENNLVVTGVNGYEEQRVFKINFKYSGFSSNGESQDGFTPIFSVNDDSKITVNGKSYTKATTFETVGDYHFVILGAPGYKKELHYKVLYKNHFTSFNPGMTSTQIFNQPLKILEGKFNFKISKDATPFLTNENAELPELKEVGNYVISLYNFGYQDGTDPDSPYRKYRIKINPGTNVTTDKIFFEEAELKFTGFGSIGDSATGVFTDISYGHKITEYGKYYFKNNKAGEIGTIIPFTVEPHTVNSEYLLRYVLSDAFITKSASVKVNSLPVVSQTVYEEIGEYTLSVTGKNGFSLNTSFKILPELNFVNNSEFISEFSLVIKPSNAVAKLNGSPISNLKVKSIGKNILTFDALPGMEFIFIINPQLALSDKAVYYESKRLNLENANLTLDDEAYILNSEIGLGIHTLKVEGVNGYSKLFHFVILEAEFKAKENVRLKFGTRLNSNVSFNLNGVLYVNDTPLNKKGINTLTFNFPDGEHLDIKFSVYPRIQNVEDKGVYDQQITPIIDHDNLLLNDLPYISGTPIKLVGNHRLEIKITTDESVFLEFTIKHQLLDLVIVHNDGSDTFKTVVNPKIENATLKLNDDAYVSGSPISDAGNHELKVIGVGGYLERIKFKIDVELEGVTEGETYLGSKLIKTKNGVLVESILVSGISSFSLNSELNKAGIYTITLNGKNSYQKVYHLTIGDDLTSNLPTNKKTKKALFYFTNLTEVLLNGEVYLSGTEITDLGHHTLVINGLNGYTRTINFTVFHEFINLGINYDETMVRTLELAGEREITLSKLGMQFKVNNELVTDKFFLNDIGNYKVEVTSPIGDYNYVINFKVIPGFMPLTNTELNEAITFSPKLSKTKYFKVYNDGSEHLLNANKTIKLENVGNYKIRLKSFNDETIIDYNYVINYKVSSLSTITSENDKIYLYGSELIFKLEQTPLVTRVLLDGNTYDNTVISTVGKHVFTLEGENNYTRTISFIVDPLVKVVRGSEEEALTDSFNTGIKFKVEGAFNENIFFAKFNGSTFTDKNYNGEKIDLLGNRYLKVKGANGYEKVYHFTLLYPEFSDLNDQEFSFGHKFNNLSSLYYYELNSENYLPENAIMLAGKHVLKVKDSENFSPFSINVLIKPEIGVENNATITKPMIDKIFGGVKELYINNIKRDDFMLNTPVTLAYIGVINLKFVCNNGYEEVISVNFDLEDISSFKNQSFNIDDDLTYFNKYKALGFGFSLDNVQIINLSTRFNKSGTKLLKVTDSLGKATEVTFKVNGIIKVRENAGSEEKDFFTSEKAFAVEVIFDIRGFKKVVLDDEVQTSASVVVDLVGFHKIVLTDYNDAEREERFEIKPLFSVNAHFSLPDAKTLEINGKFVSASFKEQNAPSTTEINSGFVRTYVHFINAGKFIVEVVGKNNKVYTYEVSIDLKISFLAKDGAEVNENTFSTAEFESLSIVTNAEKIYINDELFNKDEALDSFGKHKLRILDKTFVIKINAGFKINENHKVLAGSVIDKVKGAKLYIDSTLYEQTPLLEVGNHFLKVEGKNAFSKNINIVVEEEIENYFDYQDEINKIYQSFTPRVKNGAILKFSYQNEVTESAPLIDKIGYSTFKVLGTGGYEKEYIVLVRYKKIIESEDNVKVLNAEKVETLYFGQVDEFDYSNPNILLEKIASKKYKFETFGKHKFIITGEPLIRADLNLYYFEKIDVVISLTNQDLSVPLVNSTMREPFTVTSVNEKLVFLTYYSYNDKEILISKDDKINTYGINKFKLKPVLKTAEGFKNVDDYKIEGVQNVEVLYSPSIESYITKNASENSYKVDMQKLAKENVQIFIDEIDKSPDIVETLVNNLPVRSTSTNDLLLDYAGVHKVKIISKMDNVTTQARNFTVLALIDDLLAETIFFDEAEILARNFKIKYNNQIIEKGATLNIAKIGPSVITILDKDSNTLKTISLEIRPRILDYNNKTFNENFDIDAKTFTGCQYYLNDEIIRVPYKINRSGRYTLKLVDNANAVLYEVSFLLKSVLPVVDESTKKVTFSAGKFYLNGKTEADLITNETTLSLLGTNIIYEETSDNKINPVLIYNIGTEEEIKAFLASETDFDRIANAGEFIITKIKDGEKIYLKDNREWYKTPGNHLLRYDVTIDLAGAIKTGVVVHAVDFSDFAIRDGQTYFESVDFTIPKGAKLLLNGEHMIKDGSVTLLGKNMFIIEGMNGYKKTINFTVHTEKIPVANNQKVRRPLLIKKLNCKMYLNNVELKSDTTITKQGSYVLRYELNGGDVLTYKFNYINTNLIFLYVAIVSIFIITIPITVVLIIRKKKIK